MANKQHHASMPGVFLRETNLAGANLEKADLERAYAVLAYLGHANLRNANLIWADLNSANLSLADLRNANLRQVRFNGTNLSFAKLQGADLRYATLVYTKLVNADITGCRIHGISAWNLDVSGLRQADLSIMPDDDDRSAVTVSDLEVAQFVYLLMDNRKLRNILSVVGQKTVLILGRFTERKPVIEALRDELTRLNFIPIIFDFERLPDKDFTETIVVLAGMCRFVIADITRPRFVPLELQATIPGFATPFVPILQQGEQPFAMFTDLQNKYDWVLDTLVYDSVPHLVQGLEAAVVQPALEKRQELVAKKGAPLRTRDIRSYL